MRSAVILWVVLFAAVGAPSIFAATVSINTDAASAVLDALQNPHVTRETCLKIAAMPGNQGIIRKTNEFHIFADNKTFADALYKTAHGIPVPELGERIYSFDTVKANAPQLRTLLHNITADPETFQRSIEMRIALYTLPGVDLHLEGYVVAGGDAGGYAFGSTDFYLDIGRVDELVVAKGVMTHELYHAVQGAFANDRGTVGELPSLQGLPPARQACLKERQLFANLYEEGSAVDAEDISLLEQAHSEIGVRKRVDITDGIKHVHTSVSLLEMSVLSFEAADAMSYDDVYDVGFYGHGILYNIGYVMAKAITDQDGPQGLASYLKKPPTEFVLGYTRLNAYGKDKDHPLLGPNTIRAAQSVSKECPSGS